MANDPFDWHNAVLEFHSVYGMAVNDKPVDLQKKPDDYHSPYTYIENDNLRKLRRKLLREEMYEYETAEDADDIVEVADALGDIIYVAIGTAISYGIDISKVVKEIHRSNMSKLDADGQPIVRADGKVMKGPNYTEPDLTSILFSSD